MARTSNRRVNRKRITQRQQDRRRLAIMFMTKQIEAASVVEQQSKEVVGS